MLDKATKEAEHRERLVDLQARAHAQACKCIVLWLDKLLPTGYSLPALHLLDALIISYLTMASQRLCG
jgi:hypothetical protein